MAKPLSISGLLLLPLAFTLLLGHIGDFIFTFIKFAIMGATCAVIDFGLTYFFKEKVRISRYLANALGFAVSATTNYFLNRTFTFHSHDPNVAMQYIKFIGVALIGMFMNTGVVYFVHHHRKQNFYISKLVATFVVMFWNFFVNRFFTFNN